MIREKIKMPKTPRPTTVAKILWLHELFLPFSLAFVEKKKYQRKNNTLKHAVFNNNKF